MTPLVGIVPNGAAPSRENFVSFAMSRFARTMRVGVPLISTANVELE